MIINLLDLMEERECYFSNGGWVKKLTKIDETKKQGYKYVGEFLPSACMKGLFEFDPGYYIVCSIEGSRSHKVKYVWLIYINDEKVHFLHEKPFKGNDWALQMLPLAKKVLGNNELVDSNPLSKYSDEDLIREIKRRNLISVLNDQ
jgi:hypothetical protein